MLVNYLYNLAISEALFTSLSFLEITLRNSLHANLAGFYGSATWYDIRGVLEADQARDVTKVKSRIVGLGKSITPDRVVSELHFGFWVSLLSSLYDGRIWRPAKAKVLKASFSNIPTPMRRRNLIYFRYNAIRELLNRVFHHESVWNRPTLQNDHLAILESIDWINPDIGATCRLVDRFPDVLMTGRTSIEAMVRSHLSVT